MWLGPFLSREMTTSVRSSRAFNDRKYASFLVAMVVLGCFTLWDWRGWDRSSIVGARRFGLLTFALLVVGMVVLALGIMVDRVASSIASERERKTLDALLSTEFSAAEIVLGAMASGMFRLANALAAIAPIVVLMVFLGGISPDWVVLAGSGLASTAVLLASIAAASSVESKTAAGAMNASTGWFLLWAILPTFFVMLRFFFWPAAPSWLVSAAIAASDGSPLGLITNLAGIAPRPGGPVGAVVRMLAWQLGGSTVLVTWAIARLRPASRGLYDVEGQATRLKQIKAAMRRPPRRPPCSDDPVLWREIHAARNLGLGWRLAHRAVGIVWLVMLAMMTWWFAAPAFRELAERGYGPSPEAFHQPELNPFARMLISKTFSKLAMLATPGQARLEFNITLRLSAAMFIITYIVTVLSAATESVKGERRRDTWLGLIATPLTGREILRAKMLGSLWKARESAFIMIGLWTIGLLAGAVHPLGYVASVAFLAVSGPFYAALGFSLVLREIDTGKVALEALSPIWAPVVLVAVFALGAGPVALAWASLLTYEDLDCMVRARPFPPFDRSQLMDLMGARAVAVAWLAGVALCAVGAVRLVVANERGFDAAIGRPTRGRSPATSTDLAADRA